MRHFVTVVNVTTVEFNDAKNPDTGTTRTAEQQAWEYVGLVRSHIPKAIYITAGEPKADEQEAETMKRLGAAVEIIARDTDGETLEAC